MDKRFQEAERRVFRYDYVDGTPDLAFGMLCLVMALCFTLFTIIPSLENSTLSAIIVWVIFAGGGLLIGWLSQRFKTKVTYPRTGYVALKRQVRPVKRATLWGIRIGLIVLIVITIFLLILNRQKMPAPGQNQAIFLNPGLLGLFFGGLFILMAWRIPLRRYYLVAVAVFLISVLFIASRWHGNAGMATLSGAVSLILFLSGGVTMWKYLRRNPIPGTFSDEQ
jgi:hypothetical protein